MPLAEEIAYFNEVRADLLRTSEGKFALVKGRALIGVYDSPGAAYAEGVHRLGNVPMLIVRVAPEDLRPKVPSLSLGVIRAVV